MVVECRPATGIVGGVVTATGEEPALRAGERVRIATRAPVGHYRVPQYLRGKTGRIEAVIEPRGIDNEEEGFGRNAGQRLHYYRIAIAMTELWASYPGPAVDGLRIEIYETWLERI
ncbi:MAG: nitrile hydratase subunit beta [Myxococcales bacterium]|nr:nitrile hydratase subunit beta [Myxococcales bacterium]